MTNQKVLERESALHDLQLRNIKSFLEQAKCHLEAGNYRYEHSYEYDEDIFSSEYQGKLIGRNTRIELYICVHMCGVSDIQFLENELLVFSYSEESEIGDGLEKLLKTYWADFKSIAEKQNLSSILNLVRELDE